MLRAVADIGSNTVKYGIYDYCGDDSLPRRVKFDSRTLKLIGRIKNGILSGGDIKLLCDLLVEYKTSATEAGAVSFDIFATACIRAAANSREICTEIEKATGTAVVLLDGREEARLSHLALYAEVRPEGDGICIDMGGGSTEVVRFHKDEVTNCKSLPLGCVLLT